ncbi:hypothetical protein [Ruminococcus sp.]|uniref:DUF6985 domain-containing protein n=1 Tax=Ruminococcus sp. TaxID=41978 RepID=UPI0025E3AE84|nr:hypothetical protein [Ruminococcus sp.]MBQ8965401.1 hypothetical protein [Ruminococcus sp.]
MIVDYSKFERGINFCADVIIEDGGSDKTIEAQIQPDNNHEIPESGKETLEFFLVNYSKYKQFLLDHIFEYYQKQRKSWGTVEPNDPKFPEVKDKNKMYEMVSLNTVTVYDETYSDKRTIGLFYDCTWDEEEGMGIAIALGNTVSETKVVKIGNIGDVY